MTQTEISIVKANVLGQIKNKAIMPLFLSGVPGSGKSSALQAIAKELNFNLLDISMPSCTIEYFSGLPEEHDANDIADCEIVPRGVNVQSTVWSIPELISDCNRLAKSGPTIVMLEDIHAMQSHLQVYLYKLLLQRSLGNYQLDDNVVIIGSMNDSENAGFNGLNSAVRNRMNILPIKLNFDTWFDAIGKTLDYRVASFLKTKSNYIQEEESVGIEGFSSPRVWTSIAESFQYYDDDFIIANAQTIASMSVSAAAASALSKHVKYVAALNFEKTVASRAKINLDTHDPLDALIYPYIVNFIHTAKDGAYLLEVLTYNIQHNSFVGFTSSEIFNRYMLETDKKVPMTDGVRLITDVIIGQEPDVSKYKTDDNKQLSKLYKEYSGINAKLIETMQKYLI